MANRSTRTSHAKSSTKRSSARSSAKKTYPTRSGKRSTTPPARRWSAKVTTDSTHPGPGLFKKSAKEIADALAKKSVSPEGPGQGMRMLSFYKNRAGKNLSAERKRTLEHAKELLREKEGKTSAKRGPETKSRSASHSKRTSSSKRSGGKTHSRRSAKRSTTRSS